MKHYLRSSMIFFLILLFGIFGTGYMIKPNFMNVYAYNQVMNKIQAVDTEPKNTLDVLFIGDSEVADVYSPLQLFQEYGFTSYNLGTSAQRICDGYAIMHHVLENQSPKVVVVETDTLFRPYGVYNENGDGFSIVEKIFPLIHYHTFYKQFKFPDNWFGNHGELTKANQNKGFYVRTYVNQYRGSKNYMNQNKLSVTITEDTKNVVQKMIQECHDKGISILFVSTPSAKNWSIDRQRIVSNLFQEYHVPFIDLNNEAKIEIDWDKDTFDGGDHVNFAGSVKINRYFGEYLKETYILKDHRSDENYVDWQLAVNRSGLY